MTSAEHVSDDSFIPPVKDNLEIDIPREISFEVAYSSLASRKQRSSTQIYFDRRAGFLAEDEARDALQD